MRRFKSPGSRRLRVGALLLVVCWALTGCRGGADDYGFAINNVSIRQSHQSLVINLNQELDLSQQARSALQHGVTLTIRLDLELRNDAHIIVARRLVRRFEIRYLPLIERFQLATDGTDNVKHYPRLRHALVAIDRMNIKFPTGALPPGNYELRARVLLDENRLPAPMQLPALFSPQWRHDSEWSVWPVKTGA